MERQAMVCGGSAVVIYEQTYYKCVCFLFLGSVPSNTLETVRPATKFIDFNKVFSNIIIY